MDSQSQDSQGPTMCSAGCGFFGNPSNENFCSKCYRDRSGQTSSAPAATPRPAPPVAAPIAPTPTVLPAPVAPAPVVSLAPAAAAAAAAPEEPSPSKSKNRCFSCNKNVGLLGFQCRCEQQFCSKHRHAADHACSFDYKTHGRAIIASANPVVANPKIEKL